MKSKYCPKCGGNLFFIEQIQGWSHIRRGPDWDNRLCHYNEAAAEEQKVKR